MADKFEQAGVELQLDTSQFEDGYDQVISQAGDLQSALDDLSGEVDVAVNFDDASLPEIPEDAETEYTVNESDEAKQAFEDIHFMALKDKIETIWNIAGNVWDFASKIAEPIVGGFLDIDEAVAKINAQTGGTGIEDLGQFIRDIQAADLGDSVDQISDVVIQAKQLGAPIDEATRATLTFTHTWKDQDATTVMTTLNSLADQFKISMTDASDLMAVFFQQGGDKAGDAIQTVNEYATSWADMGLSLGQALSLIISLQQGGVDSASNAAKMLQTVDDALTVAAADPTSKQADMLRALGLDNPKEMGEAVGADFFDALAAKFDELSPELQDQVSGILFGKSGKKNTSAIGNLSSQNPYFEDYIGAAKAAATEVDNSLRGAIDDFVLAINTSIAELLASDKIDLDGFITRLKDGFQKAVGVLSGGGTIGEALEIGFNIQGFDTTVTNLERIFGNFEIIILQAIMAVQRLQGMDTTDIGKQITELAKGQLAFDLQVGNENEIGLQIKQAISRGVSSGEAGDAINTAINESLSKGNYEQAATIFNGIEKALKEQGADPQIATDLISEFLPQIQTAFDSALQSGNVMDASALGKLLGFDDATITKMVADTQAKISEAFAPKERTGGIFDMSGVTGANPLETVFGKNLDTTGVDALTKSATDAATATDNVQTSWNNLSVNLATPVGSVVSQIGTVNTAVDNLDTNTANRLTGNTVTTSFETMAQSARENARAVIVAFGQIIMVLSDLDFLLGEVIRRFEAVKLAAAGAGNLSVPALPSGGGGGGTTINNTSVNTTVNTNNPAAASAATYGVGGSIRPGGT